MKQKIIIILAGIAVLGILAGAYVGVSMKYTDRFHEGTMIGSVDVSGMTAEEADALLQETMEKYMLQ